MSEVGIVVTARVNSNRLKEKVLQKINGKRTIEILLDHLANDKYPIVLAIPETADNDVLAQIATDKGVIVYRGQDHSPGHRILAAALRHGFQHVVRITVDDILIDQSLLRNQIRFHVQGGHDYTFMRRCPEGIAGEVIKVSKLQEALSDTEESSIEFLSYVMKRPGIRFKEYFPPFEYQYSFRLTMDYEEDLMLLRVIFASLPEPVGTLDIINFLNRHRYFCQINHLPKVSIYTCNYNTNRYVQETIRSVMGQDYEDIEYIIIDDCSTDGSMDAIIETISALPLQHQKRIRVYRNKSNIGLPASSNLALELARGKYIMRVDSDDVIDAGIISSMLNVLDEGSCQGVISGYREIDEAGAVIREILENNWHPGCCLLSRWLVNELKYKEGMPYFDGIEFFERFNKLYKIHFIRDPMWSYRRRTGQKSDAANADARRNLKAMYDLGRSICNGTTTAVSL